MQKEVYGQVMENETPFKERAATPQSACSPLPDLPGLGMSGNAPFPRDCPSRSEYRRVSATYQPASDLTSVSPSLCVLAVSPCQ